MSMVQCTLSIPPIFVEINFAFPSAAAAVGGSALHRHENSSTPSITTSVDS